jgi:cathepsin L
MFLKVLLLQLFSVFLGEACSSLSLVEVKTPRFENWANLYIKQYANVTEQIYRRFIYEQNVRRIEEHNALAHMYGWTLAVNQFADRTVEEFAALRGFKKDIRRGKHYLRGAPVNVSKLPTEVDWVAAGAVTPVKNQGQCGSCWAFSTTGAVEGAHFIKTNKLVSLSEQQLVDCSSAQGNQGCNGGLMDNAFEYIIQNGGITTESNYPYKGVQNSCNQAAAKQYAATVADYVDVGATDAELMAALAKQPVSVAIEADQFAFQFYSSGVLTGACGTNLDHGVLAVGYGTLNGVDYYKVKNSWGSSWGMNGYILLGRGSQYNKGKGQCGILQAASYPTV